ncbi:hypothetical protein OAK92_01805 [Crocinitomicaceae bacterium]|nr:hypothetical protein [Crocinitomicaceae bacterium]
MGRPSQCNPCCGDVDPPDPPTGECDNVLCVVLIDENEQTGSNWGAKMSAFEQVYPNRVLLVLDVSPGLVSLNVPFLDSPRATSLRYEFEQDATDLIRVLERDQGDQSIADSNDPWGRVETLIARLGLTSWLTNDCTSMDVIISDDGGMTEFQVSKTSLKLVLDANASLGIPYSRKTFTDDDFICPFVSSECCTYANLDGLESLCGSSFTCIPASISFTLQTNDCTKEDYGCVLDPPAPGEAVYGTCVTNECDQIDNVRFGATAFNSTGQNISWSTIEYTLQYSDDGSNWFDSTSDFGEDFSGESQQISSLLSDWPDQEGNGDHDWLDATFNNYSSTPVGTLGCVKNTYDRIFRIKATSKEYPSVPEAFSSTFTLFFWTLEDATDTGQWVEISDIPVNCGINSDESYYSFPIDHRPVADKHDGTVLKLPRDIVVADVNTYGKTGSTPLINVICNSNELKNQLGGYNLYSGHADDEPLMQRLNIVSSQGGTCFSAPEFSAYNQSDNQWRGWRISSPPTTTMTPNGVIPYNNMMIYPEDGGLRVRTFFSEDEQPPSYSAQSSASDWIKRGVTDTNASFFGPSSPITGLQAYTARISNTSQNSQVWTVSNPAPNELTLCRFTPPSGPNFSVATAASFSTVLEHPLTADGQNGYVPSNSRADFNAATLRDGVEGIAMIKGYKVVNGEYQVGTLVWVFPLASLPSRTPVSAFIPGALVGLGTKTFVSSPRYNNGAYTHSDVYIWISKRGDYVGDTAKQYMTWNLRSDNPAGGQFIKEFNLYENSDLGDFGLDSTFPVETVILGYNQWALVFLEQPNPNLNLFQNRIIVGGDTATGSLRLYSETIDGELITFGQRFGLGEDFNSNLNRVQLVDNLAAYSPRVIVYQFNESDPSAPNRGRVFQWKPQ